MGVVAPGLGYFMCKYGAIQVDSGILGIMNKMQNASGSVGEFSHLAAATGLGKLYHRHSSDCRFAMGAPRRQVVPKQIGFLKGGA